MKTLEEVVSSNKRKDIMMASVGILVLSIAIILVLSVFITLAYTGWERLIDPNFYTSFPSRHPEKAGILPAMVGTSLVMLVTALFGIPLGVGAGIYLEEYAKDNWVNELIEINVNNLAGVPSIIYGLLALGLFVYGFGFGETILSAGLVLALLILPVIIVATREAFRSVSKDLKEAAFALGANKWQTVHSYLLPAAKPGIITGVIVGLARAIGEAAPVITIGASTFIAFLPNSPFQSEAPFFNFDWLFSPFAVMPIQFYNWVSRPQPEYIINAAAIGVILMIMTVLMNALAIWLRFKLRKAQTK